MTTTELLSNAEELRARALSNLSADKGMSMRQILASLDIEPTPKATEAVRKALTGHVDYEGKTRARVYYARRAGQGATTTTSLE